MLRPFGLNIVAILAGSIAMYFVGFLIYGLVFSQVWQRELLVERAGLSPSEADNLTSDQMLEAITNLSGQMEPAIGMSIGFLIALVTSTAVYGVKVLLKPMTLAESLSHILLIWAGFVVTAFSYSVVYSGESRIHYILDSIHTLIGMAAAASVIFLLDNSKPRKNHEMSGG